MDSADDFKAESEAIRRDRDEIVARAGELESKLRVRGQLVGRAVDAISQAELAALKAQAVELDRRTDALRARLD